MEPTHRDPLLAAELERDVIDWSVIDGIKQPPSIPNASNSDSKSTDGGRDETSPLLGGSDSGDGDSPSESGNPVIIDDWEGLPWYRTPSVRELVICILGLCEDQT